MTQGYLASGDAYTRRYDEIIKNVPCKIKIVDDTLLFHKIIEDSFNQTQPKKRQCVIYDGWHIVFVSSRFCINAECWYAPIEVEATAIAWALEKCWIFVMGCLQMIVVTDHQPLIRIFGDRDLSKVHNPCLFRLKEKCLRYSFSIQHCPDKWHKGADAVSRNPVAMVEALLSLCPTHPSSKYVHLLDKIDAAIQAATILATTNACNKNTVKSLDHIRASGRSDNLYTKLIHTINQGFPHKHSLMEPDIHNFWEVWHWLSTDRGLVLMNGRIIIP